MSEGCLGLCDIDWEAGVCAGCGRSTEEIFGSPSEAGAESAPVQQEGEAS